MAEMKVIKPGASHAFNANPHYGREPHLSIANLNPVVFELRDGRKVTVFPRNHVSVKIAGEMGFRDGNYSKLLMDEVQEKNGKVQPVNNSALRKELAQLIQEQHEIHASRF